MPLTTAQAATLRTAILADQALAAWVQERRDDLIAEYYNEPAVPTFTVWRTFVTKEEVYGNGFNWVAIDDVAEVKWRVWTELFDNDARAFAPSKANVRAAVVEVWKGNAAKLAAQTYILNKCKRTANRVERLFASGAGTDAAPGDLAFEGTLSTNDISAILNAG